MSFIAKKKNYNKCFRKFRKKRNVKCVVRSIRHLIKIRLLPYLFIFPVGKNMYFKSAKRGDILFLLNVILSISTLKTSNKKQTEDWKTRLWKI